jgi:hypothetical protein
LLVCLGIAPSHAEKRVALVIGNGAYKNMPALPNPRNDAEDVTAALKHVGFETITGLDLDRKGMDDAAIRFARAARDADVAMVYYSGHAMQLAGFNYLMPVDAKLMDEADLRRMARLDEIVADLQQAKSLRILVLDACRDNPLADALRRSIGSTRAASMQRGLARIDAPYGMIVAYATQAGRTAEDGTGRNSPYTTAFLKHIEAPDEIGIAFRRISADVYEATNHTQLPELSLSLIGEFYLQGRSQVAPINNTQAAIPDAFTALEETSARPKPVFTAPKPVSTVRIKLPTNNTPAAVSGALKPVSVSTGFRPASTALPKVGGFTLGSTAPKPVSTVKINPDGTEAINPDAVTYATAPPSITTAPAPLDILEYSKSTPTTPAPRPTRLPGKVVLYEEDPSGAKRQRFVGSAVWRTEMVTPGPGQPADLAVRAEVEVPDRRLTMTWSFRRNTDKSLPASHTVEIVFKFPPDFPAGGISSVPGILMKQAEQTRGVPLAGLAAKVTNGVFLIALSSAEPEKERNLQLLKDRPWFDIPVVYNNNRRAILAIEKGNPGERVFAEAFKVWKQ